MNKTEAILWFKTIQSVYGINRDSFPKEMKGEIACVLWDDNNFTYGLEYGALIALQKIYNITTEDLK